MSGLSRRAFLGASVLGAASTTVFADPLRPPRKVSPDMPAFQPTTLFLTWQRDPTTTMTVQWLGTMGETTDARVYYRPASPALPIPTSAAALAAKAAIPPGFGLPTALVPDSLVQQPEVGIYPETDFRIYRAELTGLYPGTDYVFRIGRHSPTYGFRTMPAKATDTIHFVSGGDCGVNAHAVANNVQAAKQSPMFAVLGGDLGYDNGKSVETSLAFLRNYSQNMITPEGHLIPLIPCIGNHEVDGGYGKHRSKAPFFYALFGGLFRDTGFTTLDFGDYLSLVLLDTGHTSPIGGAQASWLDRTLQARRDLPHVIAVNHVPAYPSHRNPVGSQGKPGTGEENRQHWVPLFEKHRVPVVLEHHDHTFKRTKPLLDSRTDANGVLYLGDGSWGRIRPVNSPEKLTYLARSSSDFHMSLHRLQGDERFHLALDETGRVVDVARSGQRTMGLG